MKLQLLLLISACLLLLPGVNAQDPVIQVKSANQPYKLRYNNVQIGNPAYAQKVMQAWKQFDNNEIDVTTFLAENAVGYFPDGTIVKGAGNLNKLFGDVRNSFASVNSEVYACTTLKSPDDPDHEFVVIWGRETDTKKDGTIQKTRIHEVLRFNKEGKADECMQYVIPENSAKATEDQKGQVKNKDKAYPILKNISLGNPDYSEIVLKVWKDFENNTMDNSRTFFADDVVGYSSNGEIVTGKENLFKVSNGYRNSINAVKFQITACITLKSPADPEHEIVMIWAETNYTMPNGTGYKTNAQEAWYFNRQGKIDKFYQFAAAVPVDNK